MASNRDFPSSPSTAVKDVHREEGQIRPSQCQKSPKKNVIDKPLSSSLAVSQKLFTFYTNRYFYRKYLQKEKKWNDFLN